MLCGNNFNWTSLFKGEKLVVYHLVGKTDWSKIAECKIQNGNFHGMGVFHFHGHFHRDEYKPNGLELVTKSKIERTVSV